MPRGRPRKNDSQDAGTVPAPSPGGESHPSSSPGAFGTPDLAIPLIDVPGLPPSKIRGEWNPDYFAAMLDVANKRVMAALLGGEKIDFPYAQFQKGVIDAARMVGITEREILDRRTPEQRASDVYDKIFADVESAFAIPEEDLRSLDRVIQKKMEMMDQADELCRQSLEEILDEADPQMRVGDRSPKGWRRRIALILRLRERAKFPVPKNGSGRQMKGSPGSWTGNQHTQMARKDLIQHSLEAAHVLRYMVYVYRSGMDFSEQFSIRTKDSPEGLVMDVGRHHAKFASTLWIHRNGCSPARDKISGRYCFEKGVVPYQGSLQVMPVGHGKTNLAINYAALEIGLRPRTQAYYVHAKFEKAKGNVAAIKVFLDPTNNIGARHLSLFPARLAKRENDASHIRIEHRNPPKSPTFTAAGVDAAELGGDSDFQIWDDVVPQSDADQPTERVRRMERLAGTFLTRQRGKNTFTLVIGTFWHYGDALMTIKDRAKIAARSNGQKGMMFGVCVQRCGGPKATATTKEWQPLWPKIKGVFELKMEYGKLGPSLYSAAMMSNPLADEQRIVKKLRLYDPSSVEHQSFMSSSVKYISLDPSATKDAKSDKAGVVYAGVGEVRIVTQSPEGPISGSERRIRFLDCHEIHATQSELTEYTMTFAKAQPVDYVIVEAVSGFRGIVEMFEGYGIDVIRKDPRGKNKEQRLRAVAPYLEDVSANLGVRAIAEFPGVWDGEGDKRRLIPDPRFKVVMEQILDFGVCAGDHIVDAVTYLIGEVSPDMALGRGIVTEQSRKVEAASGDPRVRAILKRIMSAGEASDVDKEDDEWLMSNWS